MVQERAAKTRDAILRGAASVFVERGYSGTALSDVVSAAGVTKGALYFHFDSKESLALAIIDAQHTASTRAGASLFDPAIPGLEALITLTARYARQMRVDPIVRAGIKLTMEAASFSVPVVGPYTDWIIAGEVLLGRAAESGEISPNVDVGMLAHFIVPTFTGIQLLSDVLTHHEDLYQRVGEMWQVLLPALVVPERVATWRKRVDELMDAALSSEIAAG
ncbi:MAG: hypothetical protein QOF36_168 [Microbacteriaceae bacterium]|jgi:AcrR family transcriptional regulator|nr:hypothetical protein [Microbacteriaceae bacterium]